MKLLTLLMLCAWSAPALATPSPPPKSSILVPEHNALSDPRDWAVIKEFERRAKERGHA